MKHDTVDQCWNQIVLTQKNHGRKPDALLVSRDAMDQIKAAARFCSPVTVETSQDNISILVFGTPTLVDPNAYYVVRGVLFGDKVPVPTHPLKRK